MTILAAAIGPDGTWIAADSIALNGNRIIDFGPKWHLSENQDWAFGACGDAAYDFMLVDKSFWCPLCDDDKSFDERLRVLLKTMRDTIKAYGVEPSTGEVIPNYQFCSLVATAGHVWRLNDDLFSVDPPLEGVYQAVGSGTNYAVGAMSALKELGIVEAEILVTHAVKAACKISPYCGGEVFVKQISKKGTPALQK